MADAWLPLRYVPEELPGPFYHVLYGQVPDATQARLLEPSPESHFEAVHSNGLSRTLEAAVPSHASGISLTIANLSNGQCSPTAACGALAFVLSVRSLRESALVDHAGRSGLLCKHALVSIGHALSADLVSQILHVLLGQALGPAQLQRRMRERRSAGPMDEWYANFYQTVRTQKEIARLRMLAALSAMPLPSELPQGGVTPAYGATRRPASGSLYLKYPDAAPDDWTVSQALHFIAGLTAELCLVPAAEFPWSVLELGTALYDAGEGVAIRLVSASERSANEPGQSVELVRALPVPEGTADRRLWMQDFLSMSFGLQPIGEHLPVAEAAEPGLLGISGPPRPSDSWRSVHDASVPTRLLRLPESAEQSRVPTLVQTSSSAPQALADRTDSRREVVPSPPASHPPPVRLSPPSGSPSVMLGVGSSGMQPVQPVALPRSPGRSLSYFALAVALLSLLLNFKLLLGRRVSPAGSGESSGGEEGRAAMAVATAVERQIQTVQRRVDQLGEELATLRSAGAGESSQKPKAEDSAREKTHAASIAISKETPAKKDPSKKEKAEKTAGESGKCLAGLSGNPNCD